MKIGIVIPLKAKVLSNNWPKVCESVKCTVDTVLNQTNASFRVAVVGHDCPEQLASLGHAGEDVFLCFNELEVPAPTGDREADNLKFEFDRCSKILKGIMVLKQQDSDITHWFALDADDLLHESFVDVLCRSPKSDAFLLKYGYFYYKKENIINETKEFFSYCGSSSVISDKYFKLPEKITKTSFRDIPFGEISHVHMQEFFDRKGISYSIPVERIIMYVRSTGDNISEALNQSRGLLYRRKVGALLRACFVTNRTRRKFCL